MALGITKKDTDTILSIPLIGGADKDWTDNSWIVAHLRHLADEIEKTNPRIYGASIFTDCNYKIPCLELKVFERKAKGGEE